MQDRVDTQVLVDIQTLIEIPWLVDMLESSGMHDLVGHMGAV